MNKCRKGKKCYRLAVEACFRYFSPLQARNLCHRTKAPGIETKAQFSVTGKGEEAQPEKESMFKWTDCECTGDRAAVAVKQTRPRPEASDSVCLGLGLLPQPGRLPGEPRLRFLCAPGGHGFETPNVRDRKLESCLKMCAFMWQRTPESITRFCFESDKPAGS